MANESMKMIQAFADITNFSSTELTDSFIKLANRNVVLKTDELMNMADVANATGKSFEQLTEAILDINNSERWREIGIQSKTIGDKVQLSWKGVTKEVANTELGVKNAILEFGKMQGVAGMTDKVNKTVGGQISTLKDTWNGVFRDIGRETSNEILKIIENLTVLVGKFKEVAMFVIKYSTEIGYAIAGLSTAFLLYKGVVLGTTIATEGFAIATAFLNLVMTLNPIGLVVAGLALLTAGIIYAWNNVESFRNGLTGLWEGLKQIFENIGNFFKKTFEPISEALDAFEKRDFSKMGRAVAQLGYNLTPAGMAVNMYKFAKDGGLTAGVDQAYYKGSNPNAGMGYKGFGAEMGAGFAKAIAPTFLEKPKEGTKAWYEANKTEKETKIQIEKPKAVKELGVKGSSVGRETKIVNINIGSLVKDMAITVSDLKTGVQNIREEVAKALIGAVNDTKTI
jgi:hypothetical protein